MIDVYTDSKYSYLYPEGAPRPQPSDFAVDYFNGKKNGIFIDIGANDGITWSNSLTFEVNYNWHGLCIEPHPKAFEKLIKNRTSKCYNCAISKIEGELDFLVIDGYAEMLSGLIDCYDNRHSERIKREVSAHGDKTTLTKIQSKTLTNLLSENNINNVDYLSVDTEGSEINIIEGLDFNAVNIQLISLECNYDLEALNTFMLEREYTFLQKVCADVFYHKK